MAVTQNTYTGDGTTVLFSFTFPYLATTDIKVSLNGTITTAYTLANATTIQFNTAPANGAAIRIYRVTDDAALAAQFYPGSAIRSQDLNDNFTQNLYVTQESNRDATSAIATAEGAVTTANGAVTTANAATATANTALSTANTASSNASAAVATANTASSNASAAVSTSNTAASNAAAAVSTANSAAADASTAISTANGAVSTANSAAADAATAISTANTASSNASAAVSTANTASTNASNAVTTATAANTTAGNAVTTANSAVTTANAADTKADQAIAAVANALLFDVVANVAAIPATPADGDAVEVSDSTGIESFTPLSGLPSGFVGDSGLGVRLIYDGTNTTWTWLQYFPQDPDNRYAGPNTAAGTVTAPSIAFGPTDPNTGIYSPGVDELALATGGVARLTADSSGNVDIPGSLSTPALSVSTVAGISGSLAFIDQTDPQYAVSIQPSTAATANTTYTLPSADGTSGQLLSTNGSGALSWTSPVDISGKLDSTAAASTYQTIAGMSSYLTTSAAGSTYAPLASPTFTGTVTIPAGASISGYLTTASAASTYETQYTVTTTAISKTLANRERCTVTAAGLTITLPASPSAGSEVSITIGGSFTDTVVARNGSNIMSLAENMTIDKADVSVTFYYVDATRGWRVI